MTWLEWLGYGIVGAGVVGIVFAFHYPIDETIKAEGVELRLENGTLVAEAELSGESVPRAREGMEARVTNLVLGGDSGIVFKAVAERTEDVLTRGLISSSVTSILTEGLTGTVVQLREDIPLRIDEVREVQIDAKAHTRVLSDSHGPMLDPLPGFRLTGLVEEGRHEATVQFASLPASLLALASGEVARSLEGRSYNRADGGQPLQLDRIEDVRFVVRARASTARPEASSSGSPIAASRVSRVFRAKIRLDKVPPEFLAAVQEARDRGEATRATIEVKTGTKPVAMTLLRRS